VKVRLLVNRAGINFSQSTGEVVDVSDAEAQRLIASGQAEAVREQRVERTTSPRAEAAETTSTRSRKTTAKS
jgi:hypothetical protein